MKTHELKCLPEHFEPVRLGLKLVELRLNDRNFQVGDELYLREYEPFAQSYSGRTLHATITHIVSGGAWLVPGYVALSIRVVAVSPVRDFVCEECGKPTSIRANGMCMDCMMRDR